MKTPKIQNAIKLIDFKVSEVDYYIDDVFNSDKLDELNVNVGFGIGFNETIKNKYFVEFEVEVLDKNEKFNLTCKSTAVFETENIIDDEFKNSNFLQTNSPAIAFPFIRSFINTITSNSGIKPIILPSFNFTENK